MAATSGPFEGFVLRLFGGQNAHASVPSPEAPSSESARIALTFERFGGGGGAGGGVGFGGGAGGAACPRSAACAWRVRASGGETAAPGLAGGDVKCSQNGSSGCAVRAAPVSCAPIAPSTMPASGAMRVCAASTSGLKRTSPTEPNRAAAGAVRVRLYRSAARRL